jgi:hypothetical protein
METNKRQDGRGFGSEKIGESSGEGEEKIGDIRAPPKTHHKNEYVPKPNPLLNKLDTNPYRPISAKMGVGLGWRRLGSLVVREEKRLVISVLHQ